MALLPFLSFLQRRRCLDLCLLLSVLNFMVVLSIVFYHNSNKDYKDNNEFTDNVKMRIERQGKELPCASSHPPSIQHQLDTLLRQSSYDRSRQFRTRTFFAEGTDWDELVSNRLVCLGTQTSLDRLYWLIPTLLNWSGPVSLSLFVADLEFPLAVRYWEYLKRCEPRVASQVSVHLTFPVEHQPVAEEGTGIEEDLAEAPCDDPRSVLEQLLSSHLPPSFMSSWREQLVYPQNLLRNLAKGGCQTNYTFIPDIDMIPTPGMDLGLERFLQKREEEKETLHCDKCAYVIPTFEISKDTPLLPRNKSELVRLVRQKKARQFHQAVFKINQKSSDLDRWIKLKPDEVVQEEGDNDYGPCVDVAYKVEKYIFRYEPLYVSRGDTPPFDERFVGFGMTRNTQVYEMYVAGYDFLVLDNAFTSHWGFQTISSRPTWRAKQQMANNRKFDEFAMELHARYGRDPYGMMSKLKSLNLKNARVSFSKKTTKAPAEEQEK